MILDIATPTLKESEHENQMNKKLRISSVNGVGLKLSPVS